MERTCSICPYFYVDGFEDWPKCHRYTENNGDCWADEDDDEITEED